MKNKVSFNGSNLFLFLFLFLFLVSSCDVMDKRIRGNGNIKSETRNITGFDGVDVSGSIDVFVKQDSVSSVRIETDDNLLEYVATHNEGGVLHIHENDGVNLRSSRGVKVYVSGPQFVTFDASGACKIESENQLSANEKIDIDLSGACDAKLDLKAPSIESDLSGACSVELKGETKEVRLKGSGSSEFRCFGLMAENVSVSISGAGDAYVFASVKLDVSVSGAGSVRYKGNAAVDQRISGAGSVKKEE